MQRLLSALLALAALTCGAFAHICIDYPRQRGDFAINIPGSPACYRRKPVCGGPAAGAPKTTWTAGEAVTMRFQQNLNHYTATNPGSLIIDFSPIANPTTEAAFAKIPLALDGIELRPILDWNAYNEITQVRMSLILLLM